MLEGVRVIDLTHHMAGPYCTQKLADMGADVIKVEPLGGEWTRKEIAGQSVAGTSTAFATVNRSKRGMAIDLKRDEGRQVMLRLVSSSDVFVVNMRPPAVKRLGLDYESLRQLTPGLIYAMISGFGHEGPYAGRPGQDLLLQSFTGVTWNAGRRTDPPIPAGTPFVDVATSYLATVGILGALIERQKSGLGQLISATMMDAAIDVQATEAMGYLNNGQILDRDPFWSGHPTATVPYGVHPTKDGWIAIAFGKYEAFARVLAEPRLLDFTNWDDGYLHRQAIHDLIVPRLVERTTAEWMEAFDGAGIWCGLVNDYADFFEHEHVRFNQVVEQASGPAGDVRHTRFPVRFSRDQPHCRSIPPRLGEHTEQILLECGLDDAEVGRLKRDGVIHA